MIVEYYTDKHYGTLYNYVINENQRKAIADITGKKTLDLDSMKAFETLGIEFKQVLQPVL